MSFAVIEVYIVNLYVSEYSKGEESACKNAVRHRPIAGEGSRQAQHQGREFGQAQHEAARPAQHHRQHHDQRQAGVDRVHASRAGARWIDGRLGTGLERRMEVDLAASGDQCVPDAAVFPAVEGVQSLQAERRDVVARVVDERDHGPFAPGAGFLPRPRGEQRCLHVDGMP